MKKSRLRKIIDSLMEGGKITMLGLYLLFTIIPFVWILITSFKGKKELFTFPIQYIPESLNFENYSYIVNVADFPRYFMNSLLVSIVGPLMGLLIGIFAAYVICNFQFKSKKHVMMAFFLTQMLPGIAGFAPMYVLLAKLGMLDKLTTVAMLYMGGQVPFSTITLIGFFKRIPKSLEEAALIDGANRLQSLYYVILPLLKPGIFTVFIFGFINCWNEIFTAALYINSDSKRTIPVAIYSFITKYDVNWGAISAGTIIAIIPTMILFSFMQKFLVKGIVDGAIKG